MPTRRGKRSRSSKAASARRKKGTPKRTGARNATRAKKRSPKKTKRLIIDQDRESILSKLHVRSEAAKKGWSKRKQKKKLIEMMQAEGWEDIEELPGGADLHEMMVWMADLYGESVGNMYQLAFGYKVIK